MATPSHLIWVVSFRIGQVNTVAIEDVLSRQAGIEAAMTAEGYDNFLFVITDILNSNSKPFSWVETCRSWSCICWSIDQ